MTIFPSKLTAGLSFSRLVTRADYPAPEWSLSVLMRGPQSRAIMATAEGNQHRLAATAESTKVWLGGAYAYSVRASRGADVIELEAGVCTVGADFDAIPEGHDPRSHARKVLDSISAVLEKRATQDQKRYVINNRELERTPIAELLLLRDRYAAMVRREENSQAGRSQWGPAVRVAI